MAHSTFAIVTFLGAVSLAPADERPKTIHSYLESGDIAEAKALLAKDPKLVHSLDDLQQTPLHVAVHRGRIEMIEPLLKAGAKVNSVAYNDFTPLHLASDVRIVKLLIAHGADLEAKSLGKTALENAAGEVGYWGAKARKEWAVIVNALREAGAKYSLEAAVALGDLERTKELFAKEPNRPKIGRLMHDACSYGKPDLVKFFLASGADPSDDLVMGLPLLYYSLGHPEVVKLLLDAGAKATGVLDYNPKCQMIRTGPGMPEGTTLLHWSSRSGALETTKLLIAKGAVIDAEDRNNSTPAQWAATSGQLETVKLLVEKGADLKGARGDTAMTFTAFRVQPPGSGFERVDERRAPEVLRFLISKGVPINLTAAIALNEVRSAKTLLIAKPELANLIDRDKRPVMHRAIMLDRREIVELLLEAGAQTELAGEYGDTALINAAFWGQHEIAKMLLRKNAKLDARNTNGATALHEAARCANPKVAQLLIEAGADLNARDKNGDSPLREIETTIEQDKRSYGSVRPKSRLTLAIIRRFGGER